MTPFYSPRIFRLALFALTLGGCASDAQLLDQTQPMAIQTAEQRGQFELNCPSARGVLISREMTQPVVVGPLGGGVPRAEYTVGVEGCNKRTTYVVVCAEGGDGCVAAEGNRPAGG